jgi:hypothetical protein
MPKHRGKIALISLLSTLAAYPAGAITVIDNTNGLSVEPIGGYTVSPIGGPGNWIGTTFQTGSEKASISSFIAILGTSVTQNTYDLALYSAGSDLIPDQLLASVSIDLPLFQVPSVYTTYDKALLGSIADIVLDPGSRYSLVVRSFGSDTTSSFGSWYFPGFFPNCCGLTYTASEGFSQLTTLRYNGSWLKGLSGDVLYQLNVSYPVSSVPAPLPIFGAIITWGYSRKIRKRIKDRNISTSGK